MIQTTSSTLSTATNHKSSLSPTTLIYQPTNLSSADLNKFIYPGSKVVYSDNNSLILESDDHTSAITNWYKQQIKENDMQTTSFIQTNSNGTVSNQLVGADQLRLNILKTSTSQIVRIELNLL